MLTLPTVGNRESAAELYLDLLKKILTRQIAPDKYRKPTQSILRRRSRLASLLYPIIDKFLTRFGFVLCWISFDENVRNVGGDWPSDAETMVGSRRLDNVHECVANVLKLGVPGDLIETGVWRGGVCIFMRAALKAYGDSSRTVWVADSFEGLPAADPRYPTEDTGTTLHTMNDILGVSLEAVRANFERYGLLDDQVKFLPGWFEDSLPSAPIKQLAVLRLDGDLYASTMDALVNLYPKLSVGGYLIVDDYTAFASCKKAIHDYRERFGITEPIKEIDWTAVYWQKQMRIPGEADRDSEPRKTGPSPENGAIAGYPLGDPRLGG